MIRRKNDEAYIIISRLTSSSFTTFGESAFESVSMLNWFPASKTNYP
jgi:hypothetical protein